MAEDIIALFIPIGMCVILPIMVVWFIYSYKTNRDNRNSQVLIEAIKSNSSVDVDALADSLTERKRTPLELLNLRLLRGCIFSLIGIVLLVVAFIIYSPDSSVDGTMVLSLAGGICLAIGISYMVVYFVTRRQISNDKAEE